MGIHRKYVVTATRNSSDSSGDEVITGAGGRAAIVMMSAVDSGNDNVNCIGWDDGSLTFTNYNVEVSFLTSLLGVFGIGSLSRNSHTESIRIANGANGWSAKISSLGVDGITLTWTKLGSGRNVSARLVFIM